MDIANDIVKRIREYISSDLSTPLIVDVQCINHISLIRNCFETTNRFVDVAEYCRYDSTPQYERLFNKLASDNGIIFLTGLSSFQRLEGENAMRKTLRSLAGLSLAGKLIIITYQCKDYLKFKDPRIKDKGAVYVVEDGCSDDMPTICFVQKNLSDNVCVTVDGINNLSKAIETNNGSEIFIKTSKKKSDFPYSLLNTKQYSSAYHMLKSNTEFSNIPEKYGTSNQWDYLLSQIKRYGSWQNLIDKLFGGKNSLALYVSNLKTNATDKSWLYFIATKIHGVRGNEYLSRVVNKAISVDDFYSELYNVITEYDCHSKIYPVIYRQRKDLLQNIEIKSSIVSDFCKYVLTKENDAIYYLTDLTQQEKELIVELLSKMSEDADKNSIVKMLDFVYPELASYLRKYKSDNDFITEYFDDYKFNKVTNRITPEFMKVVDDQAKKREYNILLPARLYVLSKKDIGKSKLYFIDAMGVEFASYIQDKCFDLNLSCDIEFARCNLPSITSFNKDFVEIFKSKNIAVVDIKEMDSLKHEGLGQYNYEQTKYPIHIIKELNILNDVVKHIEEDLNKGDVEKVFMISDHGASRLAVINEHENKWEVAEKGMHSGRCCPKSDFNEKPDYATEGNDYWCLANYDRFKGGRKANVEVHGGATFEEVAIPIVEIRKAGDKPKCEILDDYKTITVSYNKKAKIKLYIAKSLDNVQVLLNGRYYKAEKTDTKYVYEVNMPDVKRGSYIIDVYDGNIIIAQKLSFEVKGASATENRYF